MPKGKFFSCCAHQLNPRILPSLILQIQIIAFKVGIDEQGLRSNIQSLKSRVFFKRDPYPYHCNTPFTTWLIEPFDYNYFATILQYINTKADVKYQYTTARNATIVPIENDEFTP